MDALSAIADTSQTAQASSPPETHEELRDTIGEVVGSVFFGTLLKSMRDSELKGPYGHGGRAEEVFGAQLDAIFAGNAGKAANTGLADALYKRMEPQQRAMDQLSEETQGVGIK